MFSLIRSCLFFSIDKRATININIEVRYRMRDYWGEDNTPEKGK